MTEATTETTQYTWSNTFSGRVHVLDQNGRSACKAEDRYTWPAKFAEISSIPKPGKMLCKNCRRIQLIQNGETPPVKKRLLPGKYQVRPAEKILAPEKKYGEISEMKTKLLVKRLDAVTEMDRLQTKVDAYDDMLKIMKGF